MLNWLANLRNRLYIRRAVKNGLRLGRNVRIMGGVYFRQ